MPFAGGGGKTPVPLSAMVCCPPGALSVIVNVAVRVPEPLGENVTLIVQELLMPSDVGQLLVWANSVTFAPEMAKLLIVSGAVPVLVSVNACAVLVVWTFWLAKVRLVGLSVAAGPG